MRVPGIEFVVRREQLVDERGHWLGGEDSEPHSRMVALRDKPCARARPLVLHLRHDATEKGLGGEQGRLRRLSHLRPETSKDNIKRGGCVSYLCPR